jgi:hypothetical protein
MINKTQAKILRALSTETVADYYTIQKATMLLNPIAYLSDLIAFGLVQTDGSPTSLAPRTFYALTADGEAFLRVYDRVEAHKARFSA